MPNLIASEISSRVWSKSAGAAGERGSILVIANTIAQWSVAMEWGRGVAAGAAAPRGRQPLEMAGFASVQTSRSAACADPPGTRPRNISAPPLPPVAEVATFPRVICHDQVSVAPKPLKQLLAIMLVFTVTIVLNSDVAWHCVVR
jgi:hypothetical protein